MNIVITSRGNNEGSEVDSRFGRCEYFIIYDTEDDSYNAIDNNAKNFAHGAGVQAAQIVADLKADVLITGNVGPRAFMGLEAAGIKVYSFSEGTVSESIKLYKEDKLKPITEPTTERHTNS